MGLFSKKVLGVDIGTNSIKIVEISVWGQQKKLENYSEVKSSLLSKEPLLSTSETGDLISNDLMSKALKEILKEAKIKTKKVIFSLPDFLTLAAFFEIPQMTEKEIPGAIYYNASRYLTLPISEVTLDWKIIPNMGGHKSSNIKVFLIAVPNQVIKEYQNISKAAGLELCAIEAEVFGLVRVLGSNNKNTICLIDIGAKTSTVNIVDKGYLKSSYSIGFGGKQLSPAPSSSLGVQLNEANARKVGEDIISQKENVKKNMQVTLEPLFSEIKKISDDFIVKEQRQINEIFLTGGASNLPGLKDCFADNFKGSAVYIPNCFSGFSYPKVLKENLLEMSPRFSVAVGVALGILEI